MDTRQLPVDVISVCNTDGSIRPLRLRMEDYMHQQLRVDIDEVVSIRQIHYVGVEAIAFLCRATVHERRWMFELRYAIRTHNWFLLRTVH